MLASNPVSLARIIITAKTLTSSHRAPSPTFDALTTLLLVPDTTTDQLDRAWNTEQSDQARNPSERTGTGFPGNDEP